MNNKNQAIEAPSIEMKRKLSFISIVFPAYNEQDNVETAVRRAREALTRYAESIEIIVVNDGSHDGTREVLDRLAAQDPAVVAVHHPRNMGYGAALRSGFAAARGEYVFFTDADLQFDMNEIGLLVAWIGQYDIVVGYRKNRADPLHRLVNAWAWNTLIRVALGIRVRDIDCAFKLFRRRVFDAMQLNSVGALINTEILAQAQQRGFSIKEVPVSHFHRLSGAPTGANLGVILRAFRELIKMYGKLRQVRDLSLANSTRATASNTRGPGA